MKRSELVRRVITGVCVITLIVCSVLLIRYAIDYFNTRNLNSELAAEYHGAAEESSPPTASPTPAVTPELATEIPFQATRVPVTVAPAATYDPFGGYPDNPNRLVSAPFKKLQKTNKDICGWITIGADLDQAVVQRNNEYYLNRDYTGRKNANGAIFLDEQVKLWKQPSCYILYGHNMKTREMFGMLYKYDKISYLRENSVITFNTQYEDGQYAVFASGTLSLDPGSTRFTTFYELPNATGSKRLSILSGLKRVSDYIIPLDVAEDDQLLILVTCTGDDIERRFLAARRLRPGETAASLALTYLTAQKK